MTDNDKVTSWMRYLATITNLDYSRFDILVPDKEPVKDIHYKVNQLRTEQLKYRVNLYKQDRIIGSKHLALTDGGANGTIIGLDM